MSKTKTSKRKNSHRVPVYRRPWIVLLFFFAMAAAVIIALLFVKPRPDESTPITSTPLTTNPTTVPSGEEAPTTPIKPEEPEKTTQYEGEDPNTLEQLTGYLARKGVDDDVLTLVAVIDQYLHTPGSCTITLKNSAGQVVYKASSDAVADVTASVCDAFEIPTTNLANGAYQIEIELSGDNKYGVITDEVTL